MQKQEEPYTRDKAEPSPPGSSPVGSASEDLPAPNELKHVFDSLRPATGASFIVKSSFSSLKCPKDANLVRKSWTLNKSRKSENCLNDLIEENVGTGW